VTTSGTKSFELDVSDYIEEAFERCGLESRTGYDLKTAKRSLNLLFADWANRGLNQWTIQPGSTVLVAGTASYVLTADVIDVLSPIVLRTGTGSNQSDIQITRISRGEYINIPNKNTPGRPVQVFVDRQVVPEIKVWPVPEQSGTLVYEKLVRLDDAGSYGNTVQVPFRFYPCLAAGLAYYLALKRSPDRVQLLKAVYEEEFERASSEDRDRASLMITPGRYYS
jgi:hypothetical protein